jgi:hypothetical protein
MATIASINGALPGPFAAAPTVLTADDIITFDPLRKQVLVLRNGTAGSLTATVDGSDGGTVNVPGLGSVNVAAGLAIVVPAASTRMVVLSTISAYCAGVVHITGGAGLEATVINL